MIIKFSNYRFRFFDSFNQLDLSKIKTFMSIMNDIEEVQQIAELIFAKLETSKKDETGDVNIHEVIDYDAELTQLDFKVFSKRIDLLSVLCHKPDKFSHFARTTAGVNRALVNAALDALLKKLGAFTDFWNSCPIVEEFSHKMKGKIRKQKFKVHHMSKTTLVRETLAKVQAETALNMKAQIDSGFFDNICKFVAILVRPSKEIEEISHTKKAFIGSKEMKGLNNSEKLSLYLERLENTWTKRAEDFETLPVATAIGVLLCYFQKKKKSQRSMKKFSKATAKA